MTMHEQELTLFGGWAKALIPPLIVNGVVTDSVMPFASISLDVVPEAYIMWTYVWTDTNQTRPSVSLKDTVNGPTKYLVKCPIALERAIMKQQYNARGNLFYEEEFIEVDPLVPSEWNHLCYGLWIDRAFLRFFEIWKRGTDDDLVRGCQGTRQFRKSISGKIGGNYNGGFAENIKPLTRLESGEWALSNTRPLYPHIRRLPPEGIVNARALAHRLRQQRLVTQQKNDEKG